MQNDMISGFQKLLNYKTGVKYKGKIGQAVNRVRRNYSAANTQAVIFRKIILQIVVSVGEDES